MAIMAAVAVASAGGRKLKTLPSGFDYNVVENYFTTYLGGDNAPYVSDFSVKPAKVGDVETRVWDEWRKANTAVSEERLPASVSPLRDESHYRWQLPASLEPSAVMPYYFGYKGEKSGDGYPLFVYLHGSGPKSHEWMTGVKLGQMFKDSPSVYFIPQIPNEGPYYRWWQKSKQWAWEKLLRQAMLRDDLLDPNRIYFFGISEGGYGSQRLASFYADYLAGAGPMAGGEPLINAPAENLLNTPLTFHTGEKDYGFLRNQLTMITGAALDSLQRLYPGGYEHLVELEKGRGHAVDYSVTTPWLAKHVRNPYPKQVNWENFEMDGRYRDGFYNLYVNKRSNADESARTRYSMTITGNDITVNVDEVKYSVAKDDKSFGFSIGLLFNREYTPATTGNFTIYLNDKLVDLNKKVTVTVNGKKVFNGKLSRTLGNIVNSCARYYDRARLYPSAVTVDLATMTASE